jgi:hypothetical protein
MKQNGQTLVIFAVVLALMLIGMLGLIADLGAVFTSYTQADNVALLGAQAGASAIDKAAFYNGQIVLDENAARTACESIIFSAPGVDKNTSSCAPTATQIQVDVVMEVNLPLPMFGLVPPIHVTRTAHSVYGDVTGQKT